MAKPVPASTSAQRQPKAPVKNLVVPTPPPSGTVNTDARRAAAAEATIAELRAEKRELERRLWQAEAELVELRDQGHRIPPMAPAAGAAAKPTDAALLLNVPSSALRRASIPLRFSSIPVALRSGRKRKLIAWLGGLAMLLIVAGFVASSFLSRMH